MGHGTVEWKGEGLHTCQSEVRAANRAYGARRRDSSRDWRPMASFSAPAVRSDDEIRFVGR